MFSQNCVFHAFSMKPVSMLLVRNLYLPPLPSPFPAIFPPFSRSLTATSFGYKSFRISKPGANIAWAFFFKIYLFRPIFRHSWWINPSLISYWKGFGFLKGIYGLSLFFFFLFTPFPIVSTFSFFSQLIKIVFTILRFHSPPPFCYFLPLSPLCLKLYDAWFAINFSLISFLFTLL